MNNMEKLIKAVELSNGKSNITAAAKVIIEEGNLKLAIKSDVRNQATDLWDAAYCSVNDAHPSGQECLMFYNAFDMYIDNAETPNSERLRKHFEALKQAATKPAKNNFSL